jgi:hypothetical protein
VWLFHDLGPIRICLLSEAVEICHSVSLAFGDVCLICTEFRRKCVSYVCPSYNFRFNLACTISYLKCFIIIDSIPLVYSMDRYLSRAEIYNKITIFKFPLKNIRPCVGSLVYNNRLLCFYYFDICDLFWNDILGMCVHLRPFTNPANWETTDLSGWYILLI